MAQECRAGAPSPAATVAATVPDRGAVSGLRLTLEFSAPAELELEICTGVVARPGCESPPVKRNGKDQAIHLGNFDIVEI
jgi:hypothetical protein